MKYDYLGTPQSDPEKPWRFRPWLEVEFGTKQGKKVKTVGLVDSGADEILFDLPFADLLGIKIAECEEGVTMGIGGERHTFYRTQLMLTVKHGEPIEVPVCFSKLGVGCLLGQEGFFDQYRVNFKRDVKSFELVPVKN